MGEALARMSPPTLPDHMLNALLAVHHTPPRLIATPATLHALGASSQQPGTPERGAQLGTAAAASKRRASVAIILRVRPREAPSPRESSTASSSTSSPTSIQSESVSHDHAREPSTATPSQPAPVSVPTQLQSFFSQPWVKTGIPEVLYIKRAARLSDRWSSHVAFPGGRMDPEDEGGKYTAMRETWEEVGIDLAEREYVSIGQLDDREITTSLGKRLLMILSPFVFLHIGQQAPVPDLQPSEVASAHWVPLDLIAGPAVKWGDVRIDISSRLAPRSPTIRWALRLLVGDMHFQSVLLPNKPCAIGSVDGSTVLVDRPDEREELRLWGLTLGITLDFVANMSQHPAAQVFSPPMYPFFAAQAPMNESVPPTAPSSPSKRASLPLPYLESLNVLPNDAAQAAPSMTSIFPRFTYPDINFLIWLFGWKYRRLVKRWNERPAPLTPHFQSRRRPQRSPFASSSSLSDLEATPNSKQKWLLESSSGPFTPGGTLVDRRVSWAGMALGHFYTAVRKALVVAIIGRAVGLVTIVTTLAWWIRKLKQRRRRLYLGL